VVEPRIPIAIEQMEYMNHLWNTYCLTKSKQRRKLPPLFGCVTSVSGRVNRDAPIQFVTTGIFELQSREGSFNSTNDRVIIDEAHVTVEQNPGVELGIALCRRASVTVDYMSATVDVRNLEEVLGVKIIRADKARNIIWKSNLLKPIDEAIVDLVEGTLVAPRRDSVYFPGDGYEYAQKVNDSVFEAGRSHGMLVVVNSFNGDTSDIRKLTNKLRKSHPAIPVLHLASDVVRDPRSQDEFKRRLSSIESRHENYVIMATSVVEMGITFPTLDFVVTMDSGYDQETIGDVSFPVVAPLGVNSLLQRIGRVGRRRPGIAYISNEVGADYSSLEDEKLNGHALTYEPIRYPLRSAPLMSLAYYAVQQEWDSVDDWLAELNLPSRIQDDPDRMEFFHEQLIKLEQLGISHEGILTEIGRQMEQWIGRADIAYATHLQKRYSEGASRDEVLFWIVAVALSNTSVSSLKTQYGYFVDYNNSHEEVANRIDIWSGAHHEDVALFHALAQVSLVAPGYLWKKAGRTALTTSTFNKWCNWAGLDARKFIKAAQAIYDTIMLFTKVNGQSPEYAKKFGNELKHVASIDWMGAYKALFIHSLETQLVALTGTTRITLTSGDDPMIVEWNDGEHGHGGMLSQDDTPVRLDTTKTYSARITPSRETRGGEASWRLASIGTVSDTTPQRDEVLAPLRPPIPSISAEEAAAQAPVIKRSFLDKLLGR
jgi:hypothetical protein